MASLLPSEFQTLTPLEERADGTNGASVQRNRRHVYLLQSAQGSARSIRYVHLGTSRRDIGMRRHKDFGIFLDQRLPSPMYANEGKSHLLN